MCNGLFVKTTTTTTTRIEREKQSKKTNYAPNRLACFGVTKTKRVVVVIVI
jgi:hypothetical protein